MQIADVGIKTVYASPGYEFKPVGNVMAKEPITAYDLHHVLYNVFGEHIKTLSNQDVKDIEGTQEFSKYLSWYASENNISEYLICVSYVANVRTKEGTIWHYGYGPIKEQLNKLKIAFEEGYAPKEDKSKDK
jgi:hypothetical protein